LTNSRKSDRINARKTSCDSDDVEFITMNGAKVPIKEGQTTEEAVEGFIDNKESDREAESESSDCIM